MVLREARRTMGALAIMAALVVAGCTTPGDGDGDTGGSGGSSAPGAVMTTCGGGEAMDDGNTTRQADAARLASWSPAAPAQAAEAAEAAQPAEAADMVAPAARAAADQEEGLVIGSMLPLSGGLEAFGPDMQAAVDLAVAQINEAGGVNGAPVRVVHEDDRTSDVAAAPQTFQKLVNEGAAGVVGGAASSITGAILESAVTNQVMVVTPASTSPGLTADRENQGYFLRVPPSDALQGIVLAQVVYEDGCREVSLLEVNNAYGVGLGRVFRETFESLGGTVVREVKFDENAQSFTSEVQRAGSDDPDAVVLIAYPGAGLPIMRAAFQSGEMQNSVFFFSEGLKNEDQFTKSVGNGPDGDSVLRGLRGTDPSASRSPQKEAFLTAFEEAVGREPGLFAAESYDATWLIALAAQCAGSNDGAGVSANILRAAGADAPTDVPVSGQQPALALTTAANSPDCGIDYQGAAHDFEYDDNGDPVEGVYSVWAVQADGSIETVRDNIRVP